MARETYPPLPPEWLAALRRFAEVEGKKWKSILNNTYWYNARIWRDPADFDSQAGYILHTIRNNYGPTWLDNFKFPPE